MDKINDNIKGFKIIKSIYNDNRHADIYLAEKNNKKYALKKIKDDIYNFEKYRKNFDYISKINSENIVKHYDSFLDNNFLYVVMEYAGNSNLKKFIEANEYKDQYIDEKIIQDFIIQICSGLKEIHKNNIIHRNINPDNILIDGKKVKIGGFSGCKVLIDDEKFTNTYYENFKYMAPEIKKNKKYNYKVDIYALGCIIFELFTLNKYYAKGTKIDTEIYNPKWQKLIDLLLKDDYRERPDIDEILKFIDLISKEQYYKDIGKNNFIEEIHYKREQKSDYSTKSILKEAIDYGDQIKREIIFDKKIKNENLVNENDILKSNYLYHNIEDIATDKPTKEEQLFVLSLLSLIIKSKGIETAIYKNSDNIICDDSIIQMMCCGIMYKYDFFFDFGEKGNKKILKCQKEYEELCKKLKKILSKKLNFNPNDILLSLPKKGSSKISVAFPTPGVYDEQELKSKLENVEELAQLKNIHRTVLMEGCKLSPKIFDQKGNNKDPGWGQNEKRGKKNYIPPLGWFGYGLNVENKFDNGNNDWLSYWNTKNEYAIAYFPIRSYHEDSEEMKKIIHSLSNLNLMNANSDSFYDIFKDEDNIGNLKQEKCGKGIYLYQDIKIAEKQASIIDVDGIRYKILIMCRVNPNRIRIPKNYPYIWILNSDSFEIRQYRILIKIEALIPIADKTFKVEAQPRKLYRDIIQNKNTSFFENNKFNEIMTFKNFNKHEAIIYIYTTNDYTFFNNALIFGKIFQNNKYSEEEIKSYIWCLHSTLRNYYNDVNLNLIKIKPVKDGTILYRKADISFDFKKYGIGSQFYLSNFISASKNENSKFRGRHRMHITIRNNEKNNYCYDISSISQFPNEQEVLITAYASFYITNVTKNILTKNITVYVECIGYILDDNNVKEWPKENNYQIENQSNNNDNWCILY